MNYTDYIMATSQALKMNGIKNLQYDLHGGAFSTVPRGCTSPYTGLNTNLFNKHSLGYKFKYNMMY
jgi:hypothetical protein